MFQFPIFLFGLFKKPRERGAGFSDLPLSCLAGICPGWSPSRPPTAGCVCECGGADLQLGTSWEQMLGTRWKSVSVFLVSSGDHGSGNNN